MGNMGDLHRPGRMRHHRDAELHRRHADLYSAVHLGDLRVSSRDERRILLSAWKELREPDGDRYLRDATHGRLHGCDRKRSREPSMRKL